MKLEGMEFHAFHGCFEEEKSQGNLFTVDFEGEFYILASGQSDSLEDTVDYGAIYEIVRREMEKPSDLLENVATRIVKAISEAFPNSFRSFSVTVSKRNPPVDGVCAWSRITAAATQEEEAL